MSSVFEKYKNIHQGESAYLIGCGPTVKQISEEKLDGSFLRFGVNEVVKLGIGLDYWFMGDDSRSHPDKMYNHIDLYKNFKPSKAKFLRINEWRGGDRCQMPLDWNDCEYYKANWDGNPDTCAFRDLSNEPISTVASISFEALQFMLYCGIKDIYLIGHDCDYSEGTFTGCKIGQTHNAGYWILKYWKVVSDWLKKERPDVRIYSVNPVKIDFFDSIIL